MCPARVLGDAGQLLGSAMNELVPPEAQVHLLNAQRELLLALTVTVEHHIRQQRAAADGVASGRRRKRPSRVDIE
jgi:hypothetical protein